MVSSKAGYDPFVAAKRCYEALDRAFVAAKVPRIRVAHAG